MAVLLRMADQVNFYDQVSSWGYDGYDGTNSNHQASAVLPAPKEPKKNKQTGGSDKTNGTGAAGKNSSNQPPTEQCTTICFRNVPNMYDNTTILKLLDAKDLKDKYNFIYVPHDFKRLPVLANLGYFFANFVSHEAAVEAWQKLDSFTDWEPASHKVLAPSWATQTQGLQACIEKYQKSPVMHPDVPLECKPIMIENGKVVQLPPSNKHIKAPRLKTVTPRLFNQFHNKVTETDATEAVCENADATPCKAEAVEDSSFSTAVGASSRGGSYNCDWSFGTMNSEASQMSRTNSWMPDEATDNCLKCAQSFTLLRRRHHCRACGLIFCAECAPRTKDRLTVLLKRVEAVPYKRLCSGCAEGLANSPQSQAVGESAFVVKNTFFECPRTPSAECHFNRHTTSFPL